jgi:hypothetical protein
LAKYEYHENIIGHSIDLCEGLKKQINSLIKNDWLSFEHKNDEYDINMKRT